MLVHLFVWEIQEGEKRLGSGLSGVKSGQVSILDFGVLRKMELWDLMIVIPVEESS
jgi:hypothetical protein